MPQGSRAEKDYKRRVIVEAKLLGMGTRATARHIGCSERHVRRLAAEPQTRFLIAQALRPYHAKLNQLAVKVLTVLEEAMTARKTDEADHLTRLRAVERYCELLVMAQGELQERQVTWEELTELYRATKERERAALCAP